MQRKIILASHHRLADGLKDTLNFISGNTKSDEIVSFSAYLDNTSVEEEVKTLMSKFSSKTELVVLTDMTAGSVNQLFFLYRERPHTHVISGMNLPLALAFLMEPNQNYLTEDRIREILKEAQEAMVYVNDIKVDDDDE